MENFQLLKNSFFEIESFVNDQNELLTRFSVLNCINKWPGVSGWAACQCDAKFIEDMGEVEALWRPQHNIRGGFVKDSKWLKFRLEIFESFKQ